HVRAPAPAPARGTAPAQARRRVPRPGGARGDRRAALLGALGRPEGAHPDRPRARRRAPAPPPRRAHRRRRPRGDGRDHGRDHPAQPRARAHGRLGEPPAPHRPAGRTLGHLGRRRPGGEGHRGGAALAGAHRGRVRRRRRPRMSTLVQILSPDFLLRDALVGSVLVGVVCPLVGAYFVLRRMIFLGVALPQLSAAGLAFPFVGYRLAVGAHEHGNVSERSLAMVGSFAFTLTGLLVLTAFERRGRETVEARIGVTYAIAAALTILFLAVDPHGDAEMVNLLKGDILATTRTSLTLLAYVLGAVVLVLFAFRKEFLLVSFDRDLAVVFGKRAALWDGLLYLLIGITISLGVMTAGPLVTFGFLVVPPLTARLVTRR